MVGYNAWQSKPDLEPIETMGNTSSDDSHHAAIAENLEGTPPVARMPTAGTPFRDDGYADELQDSNQENLSPPAFDEVVVNGDRKPAASPSNSPGGDSSPGKRKISRKSATPIVTKRRTAQKSVLYGENTSEREEKVAAMDVDDVEKESSAKNKSNKKNNDEDDQDVTIDLTEGNNTAKTTNTSGSPKVLKESKNTSKGPSNKGKPDLEIGERVYCEFPENHLWYWGKITKRYKKSKFSNCLSYDVLFDDGDVAIGLTATKMYTEEQYERETQQEGAAAAKKKASTDSTKYGVLNAQQLYERKCGKCANCLKDDCRKCAPCSDNKQYGKIYNVHYCCFQKMCLELPDAEKAQPCIHLPTTNHFFCFKEKESNPAYEGLQIVTGGGRTYKSYESLQTGSNAKAKEFYEYVGLESNATKPSVPKTPKASSQKLPPYTPHSLWRNKCGKCINCERPDCGRCVCCRGNKDDISTKNCCLQKMCLSLDIDRRSQRAPDFPEGWKFVFDEVKKGLEHLNGLLILSPSGRQYYEVEKAKNHTPVALANVDPTSFYKYVGLVPQQGSKGGGSGQRKRPAETSTEHAKYSRQKTGDGTGLTLSNLHYRRCKKCAMCKKPSCRRCYACLDTRTQSRCVQKMCSKLGDELKPQPAEGLPKGWRFYFADPAKLSWPVLKEHPGLVLVSPEGRKYESVSAAASALGGDVIAMADVFHSHIGCGNDEASGYHVLVGKVYRQKWVDVDGRTKVVYGDIVDVEYSIRGEARLKVRFKKESRDLANAGMNQNGAKVPEETMLSEVLAFGGCLEFDPVAVPLELVPHHYVWHVPDMRHESMDAGADDSFLPKLTLEFRGFHLEFTTRGSTIAGAGKGVFVSCRHIAGTNQILTMQPGEILDLGIYAPFRSQDRKNVTIFLLKQYIFQTCEEWNFDDMHCQEHCFDITDDFTGKLHDIAASHIPCYVNETDGESTPSICAQHDPAGCVHYLLGHSEEGFVPFQLPADGVGREVFIDYGETYEMVRILKGYSRLSPQEAEKRKAEILKNEHIEILAEVKTYNADDLAMAIEFLSRDVFQRERRYSLSVIIRALLATTLLRRSIDLLLRKHAAFENDTSREGNLIHDVERTRKASKAASKLLKFFFTLWNSWPNLKRSLLSDEFYVSSMKCIFGQKDFESIPPEAFKELIFGD